MLIYGRNPVLEALQAGRVDTVLLARGVEAGFEREIRRAAEQVGAELRPVARIELDQLAGTTAHQGVAAETAELKWADPEAAFALAEARGEAPLLVLLDGITDPRNFGAIVRSAEVLGAHGVVVEERRSAPLNGVVAKTAAGALEHLPVAQVKNLPRYIEQLKQRQVWVYGAAGEAAQEVGQLDLSGAVALVVGSEGSGLRRLVRDRCDGLVSIAVRGQVESLNAGVAAGILIYEAARRR